MLLGLAGFSVSCAHLFQSHMRVVKTQPGKGGVIAITQGFDGGANARIEADQNMNQNCKGRFEITQEGEEVIGETSNSDTSVQDTRYGASASTSGTKTQLTEWRISYACKS